MESSEQQQYLNDPQTERRRWLILAGIGGLCALTLLWVFGSLIWREPTMTAVNDFRATDLESQRSDHLALALSFADHLDEVEERQGRERVLYHLIQWSQEQKPDADWVADPLYSRLPERMRVSRGQEALSRIRFEPYDVYLLREALWSRDISRQVGQKPCRDPQLKAWLTAQAETIGTDAADDLEDIYLCFDWVVRNIQLDPLDPPPVDKGKTDGTDGVVPANAVPQPRPGARRYAWEAMLIGHGDEVVRARILILLARQLGIPVVMLGVDQDDGEPKSWVPAAWIGDRLYLFDMRLGLPLRGPDGKGIATLEEVMDDPALLQQQALPDGERYRISAADLKNIVAMIDATSGYLSQRFKLLETSLSGDDKLTLSVAPSPLGVALRSSHPRIIRTMIWALPYDVFEYHTQVQSHMPSLIEYDREFSTFRSGTPLAVARRQHLRGIFTDTPYELGAKTLYMNCRVSEAEMQKFKKMPLAELQRALKTPLPEDPVDRERYLDALIGRMKVAKVHASYWLGLVTYESEQYEVATDYFDTRTLQADPEGQWTAGAHYNLGRSYEAIALRDQSADALLRAQQELEFQLEPPSAQQTGNLLRAARLREISFP
ncbi:MAG: hypothetical protein R3E01_17415 [Pirellulaceae bacterium]|nr:hypothetical protein [Planctomycetales bacterium]